MEKKLKPSMELEKRWFLHDNSFTEIFKIEFTILNWNLFNSI
jgi:hypothetical protein